MLFQYYELTKMFHIINTLKKQKQAQSTCIFPYSGFRIVFARISAEIPSSETFYYISRRSHFLMTCFQNKQISHTNTPKKH